MKQIRATDMLIKTALTQMNYTRHTHQIPQDFTPNDIDILCGRGKALARHVGNKRFIQILRDSLPAYRKAPKRSEKSFIIANIVSSLQDSGSRFIKQDKVTGRYFELSLEQAYEKTGHALRDLLKNIRAKSTTKKTLLSSLVKKPSTIQQRRRSTSSIITLTPLPVSAATDIGKNDIQQVFDILSIQAPMKISTRHVKRRSSSLISLTPLPLSSDLTLENFPIEILSGL